MEIRPLHLLHHKSSASAVSHEHEHFSSIPYPVVTCSALPRRARPIIVTRHAQSPSPHWRPTPPPL